jgi:hypothetical protein
LRIAAPERSDSRPPARLPACDWLDAALRYPDDRYRDLVDAFRSLEPALGWTRRAGLNGSERFPDGHGNALIVGPNGLESRDDVWVGASLLEPDLTYPVHHHPPEEVYLVLSDGAWWKEGADWTSPGLGGTVYNTPDVLHSFRSSARPLLAIWALPIQ